MTDMSECSDMWHRLPPSYAFDEDICPTCKTTTEDAFGARAAMTLDEWVAFGVEQGYAQRSGHTGWDGVTWVPTLVVQTEAVKDLHERGTHSPPKWRTLEDELAYPTISRGQSG